MLRAYPQIHELINDVLGTNIVTPIQSYGFFVALALASCAILVPIDFKRKEKLNWLRPVHRVQWLGKAPKPWDWAATALVGFLIGWKLVGAIINWSTVSANPQKFLVGSDGSILAGIVLASLSVYYKYWSHQKEKALYPKAKKVVKSFLPHQLIGEMLITVAIVGILGAKVFNYLESPGDLAENIRNPATFFSGLTIYGALIFGGLGLWWYCRRNGLHVGHVLDSAAPPVMLAYGIGRLGCQVSGDGDWGIVAGAKPASLSWLPDWLWSQDFKYNVAEICCPRNLKAECGDCNFAETPYLLEKVFPTSIYEFVMGVLIFVVLWSMRKRIKTVFMMFALFLVCNGLERFLIESIRVNEPYHFLGIQATQAQLISSLTFLSGVGLMVYLFKNGKRAAPVKPNPLPKVE